MTRPWPIALRSDEMTEASEHVFQDAGSWWFEDETGSSNGPYPTVDTADDAFKAYCDEVLGPKKTDAPVSPLRSGDEQKETR